MTVTRQGRGAAIAAAFAFAAVWGGSTYYLFATGSDEGFTAVVIMVIFGLALSSVAWLLTRGAEAPPIEVKRPALESGVLLIYLAVVYAGLFLIYGMSAARAAFPPRKRATKCAISPKSCASPQFCSAKPMCFQAAKRNAWPWRAPWPATRAFSFWTNLSPRWTHKCAPKPASWSLTS